MSKRHSKRYFKKLAAYSVLPAILGGCSAFPSNYLGPTSIHTPAKVNSQWVQPKLIPISVQMLNTPQGQALLAPALQQKAYKVGRYDRLNITVWGHPELSTTSPAPMPTFAGSAGAISVSSSSSSNSTNPGILVQSDGTIYYPFVGKLNVAGMTTDEVQQAIAKRLARYVQDPQVTVEVAMFRNKDIFVLGEVNTPGIQPINDKPLTLMAAISAAGGINVGAADPSHVYVIRGTYQQPVIYWLDAKSPQAILIAEQFPLQANDVVYVSAAGLTNWNRVMNDIFPTVQNYWFARQVLKGS